MRLAERLINEVVSQGRMRKLQKLISGELSSLIKSTVDSYGDDHITYSTRSNKDAETLSRAIEDLGFHTDLEGFDVIVYTA